jgi:hypothetical protein
MRTLLLSAMLTFAVSMTAQVDLPSDSDRDGLSDALENTLLTQFLPHFQASARDCSVRPAEFVPLQSRPIVEIENGTIYGQAFPRANQVELHFYHLWRTDCGDMGHSLDAEHVSALLTRDQAAGWKALYWYAAAHEDTVCDASQISRASTIDAEFSGPRIWISRGKHASFLSDALCTRGCGSDECQDLQPLFVPAIINLGEPFAPASGATWINSKQWPLEGKMKRSDFAEARLARVERLQPTTVAWANPEKRPYQAAIHGGNSTAAGVSTGARATDAALLTTDAALDLANTNTGNALAGASSKTGDGLVKTYGGVKKALRTTARKVGNAIGIR